MIESIDDSLASASSAVMILDNLMTIERVEAGYLSLKREHVAVGSTLLVIRPRIAAMVLQICYTFS